MRDLKLEVKLLQPKEDILHHFTEWLEYDLDVYTESELTENWDEFYSSNFSNFVDLKLKQENK